MEKVNHYQVDNSFMGNGFSLENAVNIVAPLMINILLKRHPGFMLGITLVGAVVQLSKRHRRRGRSGELILLSDFK